MAGILKQISNLIAKSTLTAWLRLMTLLSSCGETAKASAACFWLTSWLSRVSSMSDPAGLMLGLGISLISRLIIF